MAEIGFTRRKFLAHSTQLAGGGLLAAQTESDNLTCAGRPFSVVAPAR